MLKKSVFLLSVTVLFALGMSNQIFAQTRVNEREIQSILDQINNKLEDFRQNLNIEVSRNTIKGNDENEIADNVQTFGDTVNSFESKFKGRSASANDVYSVLNAASLVNDFVYSRRLGADTRNDWNQIRSLLDKLGSNYGISWAWNDPAPQNFPQKSPQANPRTTQVSKVNSDANALTGTYRLNTAKSENVSEIADEATVNVGSQNRDEARQDLLDKLEAPEVLAIEVRGTEVTMASTLTDKISFTADGREKSQQMSNGETVRFRATLRSDKLTIATIGTNNDYTVTFAADGNGLKVTRKVTNEYVSQTVFADSFYQKTDSVARFDLSTDAGNIAQNQPQSQPQQRQPQTTTKTSPPVMNQGRTGQYAVPNGTIITATLNNDISTKVSQNHDRFTMTVIAPGQYKGAVIEGYITGIANRSGKITGRSQLTLNFQTIRLTNGENYDFAGFLQNITDHNGKTVKVDPEGNAQGGSQTKETVKRGGIGAGIGAVIGGIIGGAKGAIIGAGIGGGAGAGSVILQKDGELELMQGSSVTVQSSAPNNFQSSSRH